MSPIYHFFNQTSKNRFFAFKMSDSNSPNQISDPLNPLGSSYLSDSNTTSDSDQSADTVITTISNPFYMKEQTTSQVIEKEIHSFLTSFCTPPPIDSVPILLFPQNLGQLINKCIRYYAAICNLAAFYIDIRGTPVLVACSSDHLRQEYINRYKPTFLCLREDRERVSVRHLYNCIVKNKKRNGLRRNLAYEFEQNDLGSECSDQKPFASFAIKKSEVLSASVDANNDQSSQEELSITSNLNAREFVSQIPAISEDNKLVTPEDMPNVSSFASEFLVGSEKDSTHPYLFAPERSSRDLSYKATSFEFRPPISSSTSGLSLDLPVPSEQPDDSTELDANPLIESTEEHESTPQLIIDFRFPMKEYLELVCALKPKSTEQISSPESASVPIIKDLQNQESLASIPQSASKCLAKRTPMFFTSTPKFEAPFIKQNVPHLPLSFSATISSIDITPVTTLSTTESSPSVEQPDSPTSDTKDSAKHLQSHESSVQPLSSIIQDQLPTSSSDIYYTAKLPIGSRDLRDACFVPGHIAKSIPITVTPVAPPRSVRRLQLIAIPQTNYPFCNVESTLSSSDSASGEGSPSWRLTTPASFSTGEELQLHGEFSSDTSASSEEVDKTFMRESKNYIDYAIEYKGFLEQAFNYVKATPFLVRSLRSTDDFRYLLRKHECIIELYNIPKTCNTFDILRIYYEEPRCLIWCDSSHALLTTQSVSQANRALKLSHKYIKSRPIADGSPVATVIAFSYNLKPMFDSLDKWVDDSLYF